MHRSLIRAGLATTISCGVTLALAVPARATMPPDDTAATSGDLVPSAATVPSDPGLDAAVAVFEQRMTAAGYADLREGPPATVESDTEPIDPEVLDRCDPEVAEVISSLDESGAFLGVEPTAAAVSNVFGPAPAETATSPATPTTADPFAVFTEGSEEVTATVQRLDESQIDAVDAAIELVGTPAFAECFETMMTAEADDELGAVAELPELTMPDISMPDISMPDFTMPDLSIPEMADLSIPEITMPDFTMPDISMPDISMPDLSFTPEVDVQGESDLGVGDASARLGVSMSMVVFFPLDFSLDTVVARSGDVLVTVGYARVNTESALMDVDLADEAQAIIDAL